MLTTLNTADPLTAADVLERVFCEESTQSPSRWEEISVHVIRQGKEPRWIILGSPSKSLPVLRSWAPWKTASRLGWNVVQMAAALNALTAVPNIESSAALVNISYWRSNTPDFPKRWSAVIHVGSPSHTRKAILFLIEDGKRVVAAGKVPLMPGSGEAILNEGAVLDLLQRFEYLPKVLFRDCARGIVAQSWLEGRPVSRTFTQAHLELLGSLTVQDRAARVSDCQARIASGIDSADFPFDRSVLSRGLEWLEYDVPLRSFIEHRDFAPWNLKWLRPGVLGLLDWEWAVPNGLPWQDICRYFYLDDVHFRGPGRVWEEIKANDFLLEYRRKFEIPPDALAPLTMRYLLGEFLMEWLGGNTWLAEYAYRQIGVLIKIIRPIKA